MVKVKRQRKLRLALHPKKFFKVFLPHRSSPRLKFPSSFIKYLKSTIPFKSTITTPNKSSWEVHVEKVGDNLYFNEGWEQFVTHNSLELGDFLVFSYEGNSIFRVKIYGRNGCEKESMYHNVESCGVSTLLDENPIDKTRKSKGLDYIAISEKFEKGNRDFKEASDDFPFFKVVMKPSYITHSYMEIPVSFAKRHMEKDEQCVKLLFSNKSWPVKLIRYRVSICRFSRGWLEFVRDNELKKGDVCVFELVRENDYVFDVSIARCSD